MIVSLAATVSLDLTRFQQFCNLTDFKVPLSLSIYHKARLKVYMECTAVCVHIGIFCFILYVYTPHYFQTFGNTIIITDKEDQCTEGLSTHLYGSQFGVMVKSGRV